MISLTLL